LGLIVLLVEFNYRFVTRLFCYIQGNVLVTEREFSIHEIVKASHQNRVSTWVMYVWYVPKNKKEIKNESD